MTVVYDTGVLIAADRNERTVWEDHQARLELGVLPVVTAPVVAQALRGPQQATLHRLLNGCEHVDFGADEANAVGLLLGVAGTADVVDGHVVHVASRLDAVVVTSDVDDLSQLAEHVDPRPAIIPLD